MVAIYSLLKKNDHFHTIVDWPRWYIAKKLVQERLLFISEALAPNEELSTGWLLLMVLDKKPDFSASLSTATLVCMDDL